MAHRDALNGEYRKNFLFVIAIVCLLLLQICFWLVDADVIRSEDANAPQPTATVVTSTYSGGVGMVRQEVDVVRLVPAFEGAPAVVLPEDPASGGHSLLRLTAYHVAP